MKKDIVRITRMDLKVLINSLRMKTPIRTEATVLTVLTDNMTNQRGRIFKEYQKIIAPPILRIRPMMMFWLNNMFRVDSVTSVKPFLRKRFPKENNIPQITGKKTVTSIKTIYFI